MGERGAGLEMVSGSSGSMIEGGDRPLNSSSQSLSSSERGRLGKCLLYSEDRGGLVVGLAPGAAGER